MFIELVQLFGILLRRARYVGLEMLPQLFRSSRARAVPRRGKVCKRLQGIDLKSLGTKEKAVGGRILARGGQKSPEARIRITIKRGKRKKPLPIFSEGALNCPK